MVSVALFLFLRIGFAILVIFWLKQSIHIKNKIKNWEENRKSIFWKWKKWREEEKKRDVKRFKICHIHYQIFTKKINIRCHKYYPQILIAIIITLSKADLGMEGGKLVGMWGKFKKEWRYVIYMCLLPKMNINFMYCKYVII